jgi:hypothetical protein
MSEKKPVMREANVDPHDLRSILKDAPPGAWVALSHDKTRIVATGDSMKSVALQAQLRHEENPILIKMPFWDEGIAAAGIR